MKKVQLFLPVFIFCIISLNLSCKKILDLDLDNAQPQLVIEGNITNIQGLQTVKITRTVPFDAQNNFPAVSDARVVMKDSEGHVVVFQESDPGIYTAQNISGKVGITYTLTVNVDEKEYSASSTMPASVKLDSLSATERTFGDESRKIIAVNFADPINTKNFYLFKMTLNNKKVGQIFSDSDFFSDGKYVKRDLFLTGVEDLEIKSGDRVLVEMQCIEEPIYLYWRTLEQQYASGNPNDVTTPANPPNNWNNRALGYFSVHTTETKFVQIM